MIRGVVIYDRPPDVLLRDFREAVSIGNSAAVEYWHEHFVPEHFKATAMRKYGYQPRSGTGEGPTIRKPMPDFAPAGYVTRTVRNYKYIWQKLRIQGHMLPLVWSGDSQYQAEHGTFRITATPNRARGDFLSLPKYFYKYRKDTAKIQPDKADELVRITNQELEQMATVAELAAAGNLNNVNSRQVGQQVIHT